jgi:hypothetical protein
MGLVQYSTGEYTYVLNRIGIREYVVEAAKFNQLFLQQDASYSTNWASIVTADLSADIKFKPTIWIRLIVG